MGLKPGDTRVRIEKREKENARIRGGPVARGKTKKSYTFQKANFREGG